MPAPVTQAIFLQLRSIPASHPVVGPQPYQNRRVTSSPRFARDTIASSSTHASYAEAEGNFTSLMAQ